MLYWKKNENEPWYLVTNLPDTKMTISAYQRRMWIEEMFGDLKKNGFDLERTMLWHPARLSRLTMAVALIYVWLFSLGSQVIKNSLRKIVDHPCRRDLSIFQIGFRYIEWLMLNHQPFSVRFCYFS